MDGTRTHGLQIQLALDAVATTPAGDPCRPSRARDGPTTLKPASHGAAAGAGASALTVVARLRAQ
jgi:hypothetical protein